MAQQAALDTMVVKRIQEACAAEKAERAMDLASLLHLEKSYSIAIKASGLWRFYCCRFGSISCSSRALVVVVFFRMVFSFLHACSGWGESSWKKAVFLVLEGPLGTRIVVLFLVVRPPERTDNILDNVRQAPTKSDLKSQSLYARPSAPRWFSVGASITASVRVLSGCEPPRPHVSGGRDGRRHGRQGERRKGYIGCLG